MSLGDICVFLSVCLIFFFYLNGFLVFKMFCDKMHINILSSPFYYVIHNTFIMYSLCSVFIMTRLRQKENKK